MIYMQHAIACNIWLWMHHCCVHYSWRIWDMTHWHPFHNPPSDSYIGLIWFLLTSHMAGLSSDNVLIEWPRHVMQSKHRLKHHDCMHICKINSVHSSTHHWNKWYLLFGQTVACKVSTVWCSVILLKRNICTEKKDILYIFYIYVWCIDQ